MRSFKPAALATDAALATVIDWSRNLQDRISDALSPLTRTPILDGVLLERVALTAAAVTPVGHGLNRSFRGFFVVRRRADVRVWDDSDQPTPDRVLRLAASADCLVDLWVF